MNKNQMTGIVRAILAGIGGVVGASGHFNESDISELSGAITVIIVMVWSFIEKRNGAVPPVAGMVGFLMLGGLMMCSGCATTANDVAMAKIAADTANNYYQQPNSTDIITLEGTNVTWTITGANKIVMSTPVPSKSVYPRDASTLSVLLSGATDIAKTATYGILGYQGIKSMQAVATKAPTVVTTEKLVPVTGAQ